ncbi:MAG: phosphate-starvation-inducible PsiE family protein [Deltaproteobacteria bacterium]|nr:phosphate-starvation-inducible PsiE family protein [Deltaproteobacteria bacterium]
MESIDRIMAHYGFTSRDAENLRLLRPIMERFRERFPIEFYNQIKYFEDTPAFLKDDETIKRHQEGLKVWFMNLFSGEYNNLYLKDLERIGSTHVKINLSAHYVNAAMHFVKWFCGKVLREEISDEKERLFLWGSVEKILDINLDALTSSYIEEERKHYFISQNVESHLIDFARRFSYGLNLFLVLGLVLMGVTVLGLFVYEVTHIFAGDIEKGLLGTLGSLLMLWVVIELVDTEIKHLKGGKFAIKVFIGVALVAVIRKLLVIMLQAEAIEAQFSLIAAIAVLGAVYWLISRIE